MVFTPTFTVLCLCAAKFDCAGCGINIRNQCSYAVTACAQSANDPIYQYPIKAGGSQYLDLGSSCRWPAGAIWASVKGQCVASGGSSAANDRNLANLAQFTIGGASNDFYDLSNVVRMLSITDTRNPTAFGYSLTLSHLSFAFEPQICLTHLHEWFMMIDSGFYLLELKL